uniref:LRRCT domain-containing protein n=1 Tax=Bracon brevicornis TaxID=1563983 RepID=A0A6V7HP17_9HYME
MIVFVTELLVISLILNTVTTSSSSSVSNKHSRCIAIFENTPVMQSTETFHICGQFDVITSVNQISHVDQLILDTEQFTGIDRLAFSGVTITKLLLNFGQKCQAASQCTPQNVQVNAESFIGLQNLRELHVKHGIFQFQPNPFTQLNLLTHLGLEAVGLTKVPGNILDIFEDLEELILIKNNITEIDAQSFATVSVHLRKLILDNNNITNIEPQTFERLTSLKQLSLAGNNIQILNRGIINNLVKLEHLDLSKNQLKILRKHTFSGLSLLKYLNVDYNRLDRIEANTFNGLNHLEKLSLNYNNLMDLQAGVFDGLKRLKRLDLASNPIITIGRGLFQSLTKLEELDLSWTQISHIEPNAFAGLVLTSLDLKNNHVDVLRAGTFNGLDVIDLAFSHHEEVMVVEADAFKNLTAGSVQIYLKEDVEVDSERWGIDDSINLVLASSP